MIGRIAISFLFAVPLAAQTKNVQDYLPLAVGNSWTYEHEYWNDRPGQEAPLQITEFTISILRTEVIDGDTYYVFSSPSVTLPGDSPKHFIAGKKLRWDGNNLEEHDGTSSSSVYRFEVPTSSTDATVSEYSISAHGDTLARAMAYLRHHSRLMYQSFSFLGNMPADNWPPTRGVLFTEQYGLQWAIEIWMAGDVGSKAITISPVRAVLQTASSSSSTSRDRDIPAETSSVTIEWDDYNCYSSGNHIKYGSTCNYPPTSSSSASWGLIKAGRSSR